MDFMEILSTLNFKTLLNTMVICLMFGKIIEKKK